MQKQQHGVMHYLGGALKDACPCQLHGAQGEQSCCMNQDSSLGCMIEMSSLESVRELFPLHDAQAVQAVLGVGHTALYAHLDLGMHIHIEIGPHIDCVCRSFLASRSKKGIASSPLCLSMPATTSPSCRSAFAGTLHHRVL